MRAADGGDRLRGLPRRQFQLGRGAAGRGLVAVGLGIVAATDYGLGAKLQGFAFRGEDGLETAGSGDGHGQAGLSGRHGTLPMRNIDGLQGTSLLAGNVHQHLRTRRVIAKMQMLIIID